MQAMRIVILILILSTCATGCGGISQIRPFVTADYPTPVVNTPTLSVLSLPVQHALANGWRLYVNTRYDYLISFPPDWPVGKEHENRNGAALYAGMPDIDIRVYAYYEPAPAIHPNVEPTRLILNNGQSAQLWLNHERDEVVFLVTWTHVKVTHYVDAHVPSTFYEQNATLLRSVAKSLDTTSYACTLLTQYATNIAIQPPPDESGCLPAH